METDTQHELMNVGTGVDLTIKELAELIGDIVGFSGKIEFDKSKPDGTLKKQTDISLIQSLGWKPQIVLREGIKTLYRNGCLTEK